jgi:hypothetical protein
VQETTKEIKGNDECKKGKGAPNGECKKGKGAPSPAQSKPGVWPAQSAPATLLPQLQALVR